MPTQGCGIGRGSITLDDNQLPLSEVLRSAGVPWSARAVSRRFCTELEAGRKSLHIRWTHDGLEPSGGNLSGASSAEPHRLHAMLSRLPQLMSLDACGCPPSHLVSLALPQLTELVLNSCTSVTG